MSTETDNAGGAAAIPIGASSTMPWARLISSFVPEFDRTPWITPMLFRGEPCSILPAPLRPICLKAPVSRLPLRLKCIPLVCKKGSHHEQ